MHKILSIFDLYSVVLLSGFEYLEHCLTISKYLTLKEMPNFITNFMFYKRHFFQNNLSRGHDMNTSDEDVVI